MDDLALRRLGTTLNGKWRLDALLGAGGMATVYAATHRNGHRVAVKMLHPLLAAQDEPRARFLREGYISNKVDHPDAVCVIDEDVDEEGNVFLVMELLEGEPVSSHVRAAGGRLPVSEALWIANRLLLVLESAHTKGVVHRDIKPENLFLTSDRSLKVLDFGIARFGATRASNTIQGIIMGTPGFAAPEQARGEWDHVDARADLFAVGATLFSLVVGKLVHEQPTPHAHLRRIALESAPPVREVDATVPAPLAQLIDRALSFRPQDRFQTAAEMRQAVVSTYSLIAGQPLSERLLPANPTASSPNAPSEAGPTVLSPGLPRSPSPERRRPFRRGLILGAACAGIGLLVLGYRASRIRSGAGPDAAVNSVKAMVTTDIATEAPQAATVLPSVAARPPVQPSEQGSASASAAPTRVDGEVMPIGTEARSAEVLVISKPASSGGERFPVPPAVSHPVPTRPSPVAPPGRLDFVETRH